MTVQHPIDPVPGRKTASTAFQNPLRWILRSATSAASRPGAIELPLLLTVISAVLVYAWMQRDSGEITAETGVGYYLGIVGGVMMLTLLAYPLRKRLRSLRRLGNVRGWFRTHMILGIVGPSAILLHSNFSLGSLNSTAALLSMIVVAVSGLAGRFLYARIHRGLYGKRQTLQEQIAEIELLRMRWSAGFGDTVSDKLAKYQEHRLDHVRTFWGSFFTTMTGPFSHHRLRSRLRREFWRKHSKDINAKAEFNAFTRTLDSYFAALGRVEAFRLYERMFAAWHLLHLPLFLILVFSATAHVVAVHLY